MLYLLCLTVIILNSENGNIHSHQIWFGWSDRLCPSPLSAMFLPQRCLLKFQGENRRKKKKTNKKKFQGDNFLQGGYLRRDVCWLEFLNISPPREAAVLNVNVFIGHPVCSGEDFDRNLITYHLSWEYSDREAEPTPFEERVKPVWFLEELNQKTEDLGWLYPHFLQQLQPVKTTPMAALAVLPPLIPSQV